jgi:predicted nuclease of restriction endonuclease-like RecB superfamily
VLTADLVGVRRRGDEVRLVPVDAAGRARIETLAGAYQAIARAHVGRVRDEVEAGFHEVPVAASERRLAAAVLKLVRDSCRFEEADAGGAAALRAELFARATATRRSLAAGEAFDRAAVVAAVAAARALPPAEVERRLFADRPGALRLLGIEGPPPAALAAGFELAQAQAVLLRAVRVTAEVRARDAESYRRLFRRLKFLRLLPVVTPGRDGGYRLEIDGPFSLFQAVTRYGLQLGLALPAIAACDAWSLEADLRWGNDRRPARFRLAGTAVAGDGASAPLLSPEVESFAEAFERLGTRWRIDREPAVLDLPGAGLCVPDLAFSTGAGQRALRVYFEVLGFWSREAVWRRIDLVKAGLPHRILFAASRHLRVSEEALDKDGPPALYVYTRVMSPRAVAERLERLAGG